VDLNPITIGQAWQMEDVPDGAVVVVPVISGPCFMNWKNQRLWGALHVDDPGLTIDWVLECYGPVQVVSTY
jgi:hypothetical protein